MTTVITVSTTFDLDYDHRRDRGGGSLLSVRLFFHMISFTALYDTLDVKVELLIDFELVRSRLRVSA